MSESPGSGGMLQSASEGVSTLQSAMSQKAHINGEPMDVTPTMSRSMGPPMHSSPEVDPHALMSNGEPSDLSHNQSAVVTGALSAAAATSSQQPKVVQTAFIHKLYRYVRSMRGISIVLICFLVCWRILAFKISYLGRIITKVS